MNLSFNQSHLLKVGSTAPNFSLPNQAGQSVQLYDLLNSYWAVLFFYPKDHSPICTSQVCAFRNAFEDFRAAGAQIVGISSDSVESHQRFAGSYQLPFTLLSDPDRAVAESFGVTRTFGLLPGRVTFVIDPSRIIRLVYPSQFNAKAHMEKALDLVKQNRKPAHTR